MANLAVRYIRKSAEALVIKHSLQIWRNPDERYCAIKYGDKWFGPRADLLNEERHDALITLANNNKINFGYWDMDNNPDPVTVFRDVDSAQEFLSLILSTIIAMIIAEEAPQYFTED